jgi:predicted nucleic acid-binding Zn ribbon protein
VDFEAYENHYVGSSHVFDPRPEGFALPFCEKCGTMNPDEATKCSSCGNVFTKGRKMGNVLILIIGIIMVVSTILVLFFLG